jgi:hypothetical protein
MKERVGGLGPWVQECLIIRGKEGVVRKVSKGLCRFF